MSSSFLFRVISAGISCPYSRVSVKYISGHRVNEFLPPFQSDFLRSEIKNFRRQVLNKACQVQKRNFICLRTQSRFPKQQTVITRNRQTKQNKTHSFSTTILPIEVSDQSRLQGESYVRPRIIAESILSCKLTSH